KATRIVPRQTTAAGCGVRAMRCYFRATFARPLRRSSAFMTGTSSVEALRPRKNGSTDSTICEGSGQIKKDHTAALAFQRRKVGGFGFEFAQDRFHRSPERAVADRCITLFDRKGELQHHTHGSSPLLDKVTVAHRPQSLSPVGRVTQRLSGTDIQSTI